jgi:hypothetical protein
MNLKSIVKKVESKEVLTCILLIIIGYMTAQLFMRRVSGFNVGGQTECPSAYKCSPNNSCESISASNICSNSYYTGGDNVEKWCGYGKLGNKNTCHGTSNLVNNASCVKCIPGGKTPPPTPPPPPPTPPPPPPPPPKYSCSSTGFFTSDKCLKDGSVVTDPSSDDGCKAKDCDSWYGPYKFWLYFGIVMLLLLLFIGGYALTR